MTRLLLPALLAFIASCGSGSDDNWKLVELRTFAEDDLIHIESATQLRVLGLDNNCDIYDYTDRAKYESDDPSVATVRSDGLVIGVSTGKVKLVARFRGLVSATTVTILKSALTALVVEIPASEIGAGLPTGATAQARATGQFADGIEDNLTAVATWSSDDDTIARVSATGLITGVRAGSATISATHQSVTGTAAVDVIEVNLLRIIIDGDNEVAPNTRLQLSAFGEFSDGTVRDVTDEVTWFSENRLVAEVDAQGLVRPIAFGEADIRAYQGDVFDLHPVAVANAVLESLQVELGYVPGGGPILTELELDIGTSVYVTAWGIYTDGSRRYVNANTIWTSSDPSVAHINWLVSSTIQARDTGVATVDAYFDGKFASIEVTVVPESGRTLESIDIVNGFSPDPGDAIDAVTIPVGQFVYLTAWARFSDGSREFITTRASWDSDDPSIAYINDTFSSNLHGVRAGVTTCSASWQGVTMTIDVTVGDGGDPVLQSIEIQKNYSGDGSGEVINEDNPLVIGVGDVQHITAWGDFSDGSKRYINTEVLWVSADSGIASMDPLQRNSDVTGVSPGMTEVVAVLDGIAARAPVQVTESSVPFLVSIEIQRGYVADGTGEVFNDSNPLQMTLGDVVYVTAWGIYSNGDKTFINRTVFWFSSNNAIASMDIFQRDSNVTAAAPGTTRINSTMAGITGSAPVVVTSAG